MWCWKRDDTDLIAGTALDVVERGVQDADGRARHRRRENEGPAIVDDVLADNGGGENDRWVEVSTRLECGQGKTSYAPPLAARALPNV